MIKTHLKIILYFQSMLIITFLLMMNNLIPPPRLHVIYHNLAVVQLDVLVLGQEGLQVHVL